MVGQIGQKRFFPAFLDAGEGQLHAAYVRQHVETVLAESIAQIPGNPIE